VWVTATDENPNGAKVRFLVDRARLSDIAALDRIVYLFDGRDMEAVTEAREAWKSSQASGHSVTYWREDGQGRWQKQS
jgi:DNA polymerase-3 subunit chi